jgi:dihydroorotate dehydrogenase
MLYKQIVRRILFSMDPEDAHLRTMRWLAAAPALARLAAPLPRRRDPRLAVSAFGLDFPAPVGLAAGLDKQGEAVAAWPGLGLGFLEIGTVTPRPQPGNPRPRIFRLVEDHALINRMGFNSEGAAAVAARLSATAPARVPLGVNAGKNRDTPNAAAADDYLQVIDALKPFASYFAINVSSPNTEGLRELQRPAYISDLVERAVQAARTERRRIPVLVKLSPDLGAEELADTVRAVVAGGADGIIATNTTTSRDVRLASRHAAEAGGLSGAPLRAMANDACRRIYRLTHGRIPIVGVGGIFSAVDAYERIRSGATLLQVYTALIYEGPALFGRLHRGLINLLERDRLGRIADAVGADC